MRFNAERLTDLILIIGAALITMLYVLTAGGNFPLDDSWIHQAYGRNLALYGEWAFLPGQPSAASTSPLYTLILAAGYALGASFYWWTHSIGALALAGAGLIAARLARHMLPDMRYIGMIAGLAIIGAWHLVWAAASGMETAIFCLLTLAIIALVWREQRDDLPRTTGAFVRRGVIFGVVAGLTILTRPEGALLIGLAGLALLVARPHMRWRDVITFGVVGALVCVIVLLPYLLYNYTLTGGLLPNTAAAKRMQSTPMFIVFSYPERIGLMIEPLLAGGQFMLIPGMIAFVVWAARRRDQLALLPLAWGVGLILLYAAWLPLNFQHGRYVIPALPALIVAGVIGLAWWMRRARGSLLRRVFTRVTALSAVVVYAAMLFSLGLAAYQLDVQIIDEEMVVSAQWIADNLPPDELLVIHDIGAVGYFAPRPLLDIAGLVSPEVLPFMLDPEGMWNLMRERDGRYLMAFRNQIPGQNPDDPRLCLIFTTGGTAALRAGENNMTIYRLAYDSQCN